MEFGAEEWGRKGATLSDKTARLQYGLTQEEIYAAISRHDVGAAAERMAEHIEGYARYAERRFPDLLAEPVTWDRLLP